MSAILLGGKVSYEIGEMCQILWGNVVGTSDTRPAIPSIALYYISLLSGMWNIDDQYRNPNINNRDHLVGQLTNPHLSR